MGHVHIYAPAATAKRIHKTKCPDCKQRTAMIEFFTGWFGWDSTCIRCGRQWGDGEWIPLEFARGVRKANIDRAKAQWRRMPPVKENHFGILGVTDYAEAQKEGG